LEVILLISNLHYGNFIANFSPVKRKNLNFWKIMIWVLWKILCIPPFLVWLFKFFMVNLLILSYYFFSFSFCYLFLYQYPISKAKVVSIPLNTGTVSNLEGHIPSNSFEKSFSSLGGVGEGDLSLFYWLSFWQAVFLFCVMSNEVRHSSVFSFWVELEKGTYPSSTC
jgi:hypothetical protein